jgi:hypothetical protein
VKAIRPPIPAGDASGCLPAASGRHSQEASAGTRQRRWTTAPQDIPDVASVSALALIGLRAAFRPF